MIRIIFLPLQVPDSNTQFRALLAVRERSFGKASWSYCCPHGTPTSINSLAPFSSTKSAISILVYGYTQSSKQEMKKSVKCVRSARGWVELAGDHRKVVIPFHMLLSNTYNTWSYRQVHIP